MRDCHHAFTTTVVKRCRSWGAGLETLVLAAAAAVVHQTMLDDPGQGVHQFAGHAPAVAPLLRQSHGTMISG
jgi:hypothetical protein